MRVLGIETSCDETAAAIVEDGRTILSSVVRSQIKDHEAFSGVVPELASRKHVETISTVVAQALSDAACDWDSLDAVAATYGPGLASSLMIGFTAAKSMALELEIPVIAVNHLQGHVYSIFLGDDAPSEEAVFPMLVLLVSGGHTCLIRVTRIGKYEILGQTLDDAAGEALDKGATLLGLGYPGGPAIEQAAVGGDAAAIDFPRGLVKKGGGRVKGFDQRMCFSFSGLKTALLYYLKDRPGIEQGEALKDITASYQDAVFEALLNRVRYALKQDAYRSLACVGGVARNKVLRSKLDEITRRFGIPLHLAKPAYCTDNAAMIAGLASAGFGVRGQDVLCMDVCPNLPLTDG